MATLITPSVIARNALATLRNSLVLANLVSRDYDADFGGKVGDTITVRTPATFTVDVFDRNNGIQLQDPTEGSFDVTLDTVPDVSFPVTSEELTLELEDFRTQLLEPAMFAHAEYIDGLLAEQIVDAAALSGGGGTVTGTGTDPGDQIAAFRAARRVLGRNKLPMTERYAVLSPEGVEAITGDQTYLQVNTSGSPRALVDGAVGRIGGFDSYESQVLGLGSGDKGGADGVAFHRSAVALVTRTLATPMGLAASQYAVENYMGLGLRVVRDYDTTYKQDVISVDYLIGVETVRKQAAVELDFGQGS